MAELKKFLFDNFIIEEKSPSKSAEVAEQAEVLPADENFSAQEAAPTEQKIMEAEFEEVSSSVPERKSFTEEEVAEKIKIAEQDAYERGFKTAQEGIENTTTALLENINNRLMTLLANSAQTEENIEQEALTLARVVVEKMVPSLLEEHAADIVKKFISDNFNNFKNEAKLSFYIHPDIISYAQETIAKLANSYDFEGKIALHKDSSIGRADCRVEWDYGGVERNSAEYGKKIEDLLAVKPEGKKNDE